MKTVLLSLASIASLLLATQAPADTTQCINIQSIPITLSVQGVYCLKQNLQMSATQADAITVAVNNVTIDFNGFKLGGLVAGPSTNSVGVRATNKKNLTLRNASIRGFSWGIVIAQTTPGASTGHLIESNLLDGNLVTGMEIQGSEIVVRDNRIIRTGGGNFNATAFKGTNLTNSEIVGNFISNTLSTTSLVGRSHGIDLSGAATVLVAGNTILDTKAPNFVFGIRITNSTGVMVKDNTLMSGRSEVASAIGIHGAADSTVLCEENSIGDFTPFQTSGCAVEEGTFPPP